MKKLRTFIALFLLGIGCGKPVAESQTVRQRPVTNQIPPTVSASRRTPIVVVAHDVLPAVVNIQTEATMRQRNVDPFLDPFGFFGGRERSYTSQSLGSGFVWSSDGIIVTNNHVVEGASRITVNVNGGRQIPAKLLGVDPDSDLAVLRVDEKGLSAAPLGTSSDLMIGETVVAVGNPFGLSGTVTTGVVSALGRSVPSQDQSRTFTDFIQTDASINPGNSGGPLLNIEGKVIGINVAIYAQAQGIGFAIPVDRAKKVIEDLLRYGAVHSAWFGAVTATLTPEEAKRLGAQPEPRRRRGARVRRLTGGTRRPAQRRRHHRGERTGRRFARSILHRHRHAQLRPERPRSPSAATARRARSISAPPSLPAISDCASWPKWPGCVWPMNGAPWWSTKCCPAHAPPKSDWPRAI